ncbi:MAG: hypothetical protein J1F05_02635 [Muribaculaceae bacterium]|nr:hypothetical protein [Muribaculaceae bacterium]
MDMVESPTQQIYMGCRCGPQPIDWGFLLRKRLRRFSLLSGLRPDDPRHGDIGGSPSRRDGGEAPSLPQPPR